MKIIVDLTPIRFDGQVGGAMPFSLELVKALSARKDVSLTILTGQWNHEPIKAVLSPNPVKYINTSDEQQKPIGNRTIANRVLNIWNKCCRRLRCLGLVGQEDADLLFCPMSAISFWKPGRPTVSTILDIQHEFYPQFFAPQELNHRRSFYENICARADAIICISEFTRTTFIKHLGFPMENSFVSHIGIQNRLTLFDEAATTKKFSQLNLDGRKYAFYPANFWPHKNHKVLITAFAAFCHHFPQFDLHIVFTGNELDASDDLRTAISVMGIEERVHILGYVEDLTLAALYRHCSFLVFPSLYEGFGIPVVEAMQFGKPVLCSNQTSLPEVAGEAALYFDPRIPQEIENAMYRVLTEPALCRELQYKGIQQAKAYTMENMVSQYMDVFKSITQSKSREEKLIEA